MKVTTQSFASVLLLGAALSIAALCAPRSAAAQSFDHLKCYPIRDSERSQWLRTDILPLDAVFVDDSGSQVDALLGKGCRVMLPARELCIAVSATESSDTPTPTPSGSAAAATDASDFLCYLLHCSESNERTRLSVTDSFGSHQIEVLDRPSRLCAPATRSNASPTPRPTGTPLGTPTSGSSATPIPIHTPGPSATPIPIQTPRPSTTAASPSGAFVDLLAPFF